MSNELKERVALITGASRGLGRALALGMAEAGAHLILVARTTGALEELDDEIRDLGGEATLVPMDLADGPAIERLGGAVAERWGRLDILVGNAGILGQLAPTNQIDPKIWERVYAVNVTANWRLIRSFDPLLRASDAGRAVFVTCSQARIPKPFWAAVASSKAALESLVSCYAGELARTKVRVNLFDPGPIRTALRAQAMPGENRDDIPPPESCTHEILALCLASNMRQGEIVAASAIRPKTHA